MTESIELDIINQIKLSNSDEKLKSLLNEYHIFKKKQENRTYYNKYYNNNAEKINEKQKQRYQEKIKNQEKKKPGRPRKNIQIEEKS
jgi:hypothetical protein